MPFFGQRQQHHIAQDAVLAGYRVVCLVAHPLQLLAGTQAVRGRNIGIQPDMLFQVSHRTSKNSSGLLLRMHRNFSRSSSGSCSSSAWARTRQLNSEQRWLAIEIVFG